MPLMPFITFEISAYYAYYTPLTAMCKYAIMTISGSNIYWKNKRRTAQETAHKRREYDELYH